MGRFLTLCVLLVMIMGVLLHREVDLGRWGDWVGRLPGDLILKRKGVILYFPFTSSLFVSGISFLVIALFRKKS